MEVPLSQLKLGFSPPCAQFFYDKEIPRYEKGFQEKEALKKFHYTN